MPPAKGKKSSKSKDKGKAAKGDDEESSSSAVGTSGPAGDAPHNRGIVATYKAALDAETSGGQGVSLSHHVRRVFAHLDVNAQTLHAQARALLMSLMNSLSNKRKGKSLRPTDFKAALEDVVMLLWRGGEEHNSLQCCLLLLRLVNASRLRLLDLSIHIKRRLLIFIQLKFNDLANSGFEDPAGMTISYPDAAIILFGEDIGGATKDKRAGQAGSMFQKEMQTLAELVRTAKSGRLGHWASVDRLSRHAWGEVLLDCLAEDVELVGKRRSQQMAALRTSLRQSGGAKIEEDDDEGQERQHLVVVDGELQFTFGEPEIKPISKEDHQKLASMLVEKLCSLPPAERIKHASELLEVDEATVAQVMAKHKVRHDKLEWETQELIQLIRTMNQGLQEQHAGLDMDSEQLSTMRQLNNLVPGQPRSFYEKYVRRWLEGEGVGQLYPYPTPDPGEACHLLVDRNRPEEWLQRFDQLREAFMGRSGREEPDIGLLQARDIRGPAGEASGIRISFSEFRKLSAADLMVHFGTSMRHHADSETIRGLLRMRAERGAQLEGEGMPSAEWATEHADRHRKLMRRKGVAYLEIACCGQQLCEQGASIEDIQNMQTKMRSSYREILSTRLSTDHEGPEAAGTEFGLLEKYAQDTHGGASEDIHEHRPPLPDDLKEGEEDDVPTCEEMLMLIFQSLQLLSSFGVLTWVLVNGLASCTRAYLLEAREAMLAAAGTRAVARLDSGLEVSHISWHHLGLLNRGELLKLHCLLCELLGDVATSASAEDHMRSCLTLAEELIAKRNTATSDQKQPGQAPQFKIEDFVTQLCQCPTCVERHSAAHTPGGSPGCRQALEAGKGGKEATEEDPAAAREDVTRFVELLLDCLLGDNPHVANFYGAEVSEVASSREVQVELAKAMDEVLSQSARQKDLERELDRCRAVMEKLEETEIKELTPECLHRVFKAVAQISLLLRRMETCPKDLAHHAFLEHLLAVHHRLEVTSRMEGTSGAALLLGDNRLPDLRGMVLEVHKGMRPNFVEAVTGLCNHLLQNRVVNQNYMIAHVNGFKALIEEMVDRYTDSPHKQWYRKLGLCLKEKLHEWLDKGRKKEREDAERELLEWDEKEKAPAAVKVNEKKQRKKAAKKVKEQANQEASSAAEAGPAAATLAGEGEGDRAQAVEGPRGDAGAGPAAATQPEEAEQPPAAAPAAHSTEAADPSPPEPEVPIEEGWTHVDKETPQPSSGQAANGHKPAAESSSAAAGPSNADQREEDDGAGFVPVSGRRGHRGKAGQGDQVEQQGWDVPAQDPSTQSWDTGFDAAKVDADGWQTYTPADEESEWTSVKTSSRQSRRDAAQEGQSGPSTGQTAAEAGREAADLSAGSRPAEDERNDRQAQGSRSRSGHHGEDQDRGQPSDHPPPGLRQEADHKAEPQEPPERPSAPRAAAVPIVAPRQAPGAEVPGGQNPPKGSRSSGDRRRQDAESEDAKMERRESERLGKARGGGGRRLRCLVCDSEHHLVRDCPELPEGTSYADLSALFKARVEDRPGMLERLLRGERLPPTLEPPTGRVLQVQRPAPEAARPAPEAAARGGKSGRGRGGSRTTNPPCMLCDSAEHAIKFCPQLPAGITSDQISNVIQKKLENRPEAANRILDDVRKANHEAKRNNQPQATEKPAKGRSRLKDPPCMLCDSEEHAINVCPQLPQGITTNEITHIIQARLDNRLSAVQHVLEKVARREQESRSNAATEDGAASNSRSRSRGRPEPNAPARGVEIRRGSGSKEERSRSSEDRLAQSQDGVPEASNHSQEEEARHTSAEYPPLQHPNNEYQAAGYPAEEGYHNEHQASETPAEEQRYGEEHPPQSPSGGYPSAGPAPQDLREGHPDGSYPQEQYPPQSPSGGYSSAAPGLQDLREGHSDGSRPREQWPAPAGGGRPQEQWPSQANRDPPVPQPQQQRPVPIGPGLAAPRPMADPQGARMAGPPGFMRPAQAPPLPGQHREAAAGGSVGGPTPLPKAPGPWGPAAAAAAAAPVSMQHPATVPLMEDSDGGLSEFLSQMGVAPFESQAQPPAGPSYSSIASPQRPPHRVESDEDNDADLQKALQASLRETTLSAEERYRAESQGGPGGGGMQLAVAGIATPGLQNNVGEYNCFLNCILQCLWNCREFRPNLQSWQPQRVQGNAIVAALVELFQSFAAEENHVWKSRQRQIVSPAALRKALHSYNEARFQLGEMSDASEVLSAIYESLSMVEEGRDLIRNLFEWEVKQNVNCNRCQLVSHSTKHSQFFYHTSATALRIEAAVDRARHGSGGEAASLGQLLARIEGQTLKTCDKDKRGCGRLLPVLNNLVRPRRVFTLQLGWEKEREDADDIRATMATITETVDVADVFDGGEPGYFLYSLNGMVCYYGLHYHAFVKDAETGVWRMFDDTTVSEVGNWRAVQQKCFVGKIQPSVLFYQATWVPKRR